MSLRLQTVFYKNSPGQPATNELPTRSTWISASRYFSRTAEASPVSSDFASVRTSSAPKTVHSAVRICACPAPLL